MNIRSMEPEDWRGVRDIYAYAISEGKSTFRTTCSEKDEWDKAHLKSPRLVAETDGGIVGWCALSPTSAREEYMGVCELSVYVNKDYRRQGIGEKLIERMIKLSRENGIWCLYSAVFSINTASIMLHKKCGFRVVGYREKIARDRFGEWQDMTLFELRAPEEND